jgi:hypothetical protein
MNDIQRSTSGQVLFGQFRFLPYRRPCHVAERGTQKRLHVVNPQATAARQVFIAAARKPRCVDAEVR